MVSGNGIASKPTDNAVHMTNATPTLIKQAPLQPLRRKGITPAGATSRLRALPHS